MVVSSSWSFFIRLWLSAEKKALEWIRNIKFSLKGYVIVFLVSFLFAFRQFERFTLFGVF